MKYIFNSIFCLLLAYSSFAQAPTTFIAQDVGTTANTFTIGIAFDASAPGPVVLDNSSIVMFVDGGYTGAVINDLQGGAWSQLNFVSNFDLSGFCPGVTESYAMLIITTGGQAGLGSVTNGVREALVSISLTGPGDIAVPIKLYDPTLVDPLSSCVQAFGVDNTASIDPDGNGGVAPTVGYSQIPGGPPIILPVELLSFTAKKLNNNSVGLRWTTSSEINSSHFEVEKSKDGITFDKIGDVRAAGYSNMHLDYSFIDKAVNASTIGNQVTTYYYRLKMVDLDGLYEYSDIRSASFGGQSTPRLSVFPNPAINRLSVDASGIKGEVKIHMIDMLGKLVYKDVILDETTIHDIYLDETTLTSGTYFMQFIQDNAVIDIQKVIILKY